VESLQDWLTQPAGIATRLRLMRAQAGLSGAELGAAHRWAQSKVSRIENGKQLPSADDIQAWATACDADSSTVAELLSLLKQAEVVRATFRTRMHQGQEQVQASYNDFVANSRLIRHFETAYVPGLLQVPGYARRVFAEMIALHDLAIDDVDAAVAMRMQRQQMLYDPSKQFEFLLAEPVLRWMLAPAAVMREQLDRLQTVIGLDRIRFGIVPMGVELAVTPQNSFQLYVGDDSVVAVETFIGETFARGEAVDAYGRALDRLWDQAVTGDQARRLIIAAMEALGS
jgi:transcriptional regulator with XRE-family HTH domain